MFTPEGHSLEPCDMSWWSLTCNIAREWQLMMEDARLQPPRVAANEKPSATIDSTVIYLRDALRIRRERRFGAEKGYPGADDTNVVQFRPGPR